MRVTNGIPLGCSLLFPVGTVNSVQTLKATAALIATLTLTLTLTMNSAQTRKAWKHDVERCAANHELCHTPLNGLKVAHTGHVLGIHCS
jgi:hypothetical protein